MRAKVEHPFLIVKRDFGLSKTRYRGMTKNLNHVNVLFASANWVMQARAVSLMRRQLGARLPTSRQNHPEAPSQRPKQCLLSSSRTPGSKLGR